MKNINGINLMEATTRPQLHKVLTPEEREKYDQTGKHWLKRPDPPVMALETKQLLDHASSAPKTGFMV